jgi:hypothetical protein
MKVTNHLANPNREMGQMRAASSPPHHQTPVAALAALAAVAMLAACDASRSPTGTTGGPGGSPADGAGLAGVDPAAIPTQVLALGTLPLPVNQSVSYSGTALRVTNTGTGGAGGFLVSNSGNASPALLGQTNGTGPAVKGYQTSSGQAGWFQIANGSNAKSAVYGVTNGTGTGGWFEITNSANQKNAVYAKTIGTGNAVMGEVTGFGTAGFFRSTSTSSGSNTVTISSAGPGNALSAFSTGTGIVGYFVGTNGGGSNPTVNVQGANGGPALNVTTSGSGHAGSFESSSASNGSGTILARQRGIGVAANFVINNPNNFSDAAFIYTDGVGWAGHFRGAGPGSKGVLIETSGAAGLQVVGGTKNAVVGTTTGARELYTEESSEVWFTDYGFGKLTGGRARILLDPTFAETIETDAPYHVFVEPYGDASLYVADRTRLGFVVRLRDGESGVEFSYRVVAKRRGFAGKRLDRAPWVDGSAGLATADRCTNCQ